MWILYLFIISYYGSYGFLIKKTEVTRLPRRPLELKARIVNENNDDDKFSRMDEYLNKELEKLLEVIPIYPEKEEDIKIDTMENYLREEFIVLSNKEDKINFKTYYKWRKEKGTFLEKEEILNIFNEIVSVYDECSLMEFIKINRTIDDDY